MRIVHKSEFDRGEDRQSPAEVSVDLPRIVDQMAEKRVAWMLARQSGREPIDDDQTIGREAASDR